MAEDDILDFPAGGEKAKNHIYFLLVLGENFTKMKEDDELQEIRGKYYDKEQIKFIPLRKPNLRLLKAHEVEMIDDVLKRHSDKSATDISNYSHKDVPWKVHEMGEVIDYESVFYRDAEFSVRDDNDEL